MESVCAGLCCARRVAGLDQVHRSLVWVGLHGVGWDGPNFMATMHMCCNGFIVTCMYICTVGYMPSTSSAG